MADTGLIETDSSSARVPDTHGSRLKASGDSWAEKREEMLNIRIQSYGMPKSKNIKFTTSSRLSAWNVFSGEKHAESGDVVFRAAKWSQAWHALPQDENEKVNKCLQEKNKREQIAI